MIRTAGLTHIHLTVRDLDAAQRFYANVFGMEERFRIGGHMRFMHTPGSHDLLTLNGAPAHREVAGRPGGVEHFGFRIADEADIDRAIALAERWGGRLVEKGERFPAERFAYLADPDGYVVELSVWKRAMDASE